MTTWQAVILIGCGVLNILAVLSLGAVAMVAVREPSKATRPQRTPPHQVRRPRQPHGPRTVLISPQGQTQRLPRHVPEQRTVRIDLGSAT